MKELINSVISDYAPEGSVTLTQQQLHDMLKYFASRVSLKHATQITEMLSSQISDDINN